MGDTVHHLVECAFGKVRYFREIDLADTDHETVIRDLLSGEFDHPRRIIAFNTREGWSRDVSEDIAREVVDRVSRNAGTLADGVREFCERQGIPVPFAVAAE